MHFLPDTSAMAKRYVDEPGSPQVLQLLTNPRTVITVSQLVRTEFASVLGRRRREGRLGGNELSEAWDLFLAHLRERYNVARISTRMQADAERLLFAHPLRAADALHVACALEVAAAAKQASQEFTFLTADRRQANAAEAEGLTVIYVGD